MLLSNYGKKVNSETTLILGAILIVGVLAIGAFLYNQNQDRNLIREQQMAEDRKAEQARNDASREALLDQAEKEAQKKDDQEKYQICVLAAGEKYDKTLEINSWSSYIDEDGETIYK